MPWRWFVQVLFVILAAANFAFGDDDAPADAIHPARAARTNYLRDIQPIFDKHCVSCHGQEQLGSGLRLDSASYARKGGATQRPILDGTLATNEIFQRVTSNDPAYRMPKGGAPLSEQELALIRQWVEDGCPTQDHPTPSALSMPTVAKPWWEIWFDRVELFAGWLQENRYSTLFLYVGLGLLIVMLIWQRFPRLALLRSSQQMLLLVMYVGIFLYFQQKGTADSQRKRGDELQQQLTQMAEARRKAESPNFFERYGRPPRPVRLLHPKALSRTYYRGNCERNSNLFNEGNYCTNTFELRLQSANGQSLKYSDPVPTAGVSVHFEIVRSPGSTPLLYKDDQMSHVFVSSGAFEETPKLQADFRLSTIQSGERWAVDLPIADCPTQDGQLTRRFYVNNGGPASESNSSYTHYAFELNLTVKDGKISPDSDLWMGCLFVPPKVIPPDDSRIPFCEWFDWRPLPIIQGDNTKDLKLLGVLEHHPELKEKASSPPPENDHGPPPPARPTEP